MKIQEVRLGLFWFALSILLYTACSNPNGEENEGLSNESQSDTRDSANQGVDFFHGSLKDARTLAAQEDKLVFVYLYGDSIGSSIVMLEAVFPKLEVGEYFNERFVNYQVDLQKEYQRNRDLEIDYQFDVVIPAYLILDSEGNVLGQTHGGASPRQIISIISRAIGETKSMFAALLKRYEMGERSTGFIQQFLMDAIEELAFRKLDRQDEASAQAYKDEGAKYKKIADEYFERKPYTDLINETDAHLIMYFYEHSGREDELVEFVLDRYDEFLAVSSEVAMANFTFAATNLALGAAARTGDDRYVEYIESLERYPLNQAVEYERSRGRIRYFPEHVRYVWDLDFLKANGDWDAVHDVYIKRLEEMGDNVPARVFTYVARELLEVEHPTVHRAAVEYGRKAFELDHKNPQFAAIYISALLGAGKKYSAVQISEQYRKRMSHTEHDKVTLNEFNSLLSTRLERNIETSP